MPGRFTVKLTPSLQRDLERLPRPDRGRVLTALVHLETEPSGPAPHVKKLKGEGAGQWRLRAGAHRVRYDVIRRDVVLYRVRHRKEIYRG